MGRTRTGVKRPRRSAGETREPWEFESALAWRLMMQYAPERWSRLDPEPRRRLKKLARKVLFRSCSAARETLNLLSWTYARVSADAEEAAISVLNLPEGLSPRARKRAALQNLARVRKALNSLLDACATLDAVAAAAFLQGLRMLDGPEGPAQAEAISPAGADDEQDPAADADIDLFRQYGVADRPAVPSHPSPLELVCRLSAAERNARLLIEADGLQSIGAHLPPVPIPREPELIHRLAARRLAWLWWRATGEKPTTPRHAVLINKSVEGQEYYGLFVELVRGFFDIAGLEKPEVSADQAGRWLPSVIAKFEPDGGRFFR